MRNSRRRSSSERVPEIHEEDLPLVAETVVEANGRDQVPDQTEADAVVGAPAVEAQLRAIEDAAGIHERGKHWAQVLAKEVPAIVEAPAQLCVRQHGRFPNKALIDEAAHGVEPAEPAAIARVQRQRRQAEEGD